MRVSLLAAVLLPLSFAHAQAASAVTYGTGCSYFGQTLSIGFQGLPQLGTTFSITYDGPNLNNTLSVQPIIALGFTADATLIPDTILPSQPTGCTAWIVPVVLFPMFPDPVTGQFGEQLDIAIPNNTSLIGAQFVSQWLAIAIQCGIVPPCWWDALPTSDGLLATIGT